MTEIPVQNLNSKSVQHKNLIERNPLLSSTLLIFITLLFADIIAGWFLIPRQYNTFREPHYFYHHGLLPNQSAMDGWHSREYPFYTNSLGFRDCCVRDIPLSTSNRRIVLMGDSFVEGQGVSFENSFAGILQKTLAPQGTEVLNAAVVSYSPKLYYLKTRYLLENANMKFQELVVFIDISDIQNEIVYQNFVPQVIAPSKMFKYRLAKNLKKMSYTYSTMDRFAGTDMMPDFGKGIFGDPFNRFDAQDNEVVNNTYDLDFVASWTYDTSQFELFGIKGLKLALSNMTALADLCRRHGIKLSIEVHPWPDQIIRRDLNGLQTVVWKKFCEETGATFINLFPIFINNSDGRDVIDSYYIPGDVHWNESGHSLVAAALLPYVTLESRSKQNPE